MSWPGQAGLLATVAEVLLLDEKMALMQTMDNASAPVATTSIRCPGIISIIVKILMMEKMTR